MKFSLTEWGTWVQGCQFHTRSCDLVFLSLLDNAPSHTLVNFSLKVRSVSTFLGYFFCGSFCYHCDVDRTVNKVQLHCHVADNWHSVC